MPTSTWMSPAGSRPWRPGSPACTSWTSRTRWPRSLVATVPLVDGASRVEVLDGLAIVASGENLVSIDLASHEIRQTLPLGSNPLTDVATEGGMIYTMDTGLNLRARDASTAW